VICKHCAAVGLPEPVTLDEPLGTSGRSVDFRHRTEGRWLLLHAQAGDVLLVTKLDRLGRTAKDKVGKRSEWDMQQLADIAEIAERMGKSEDVLLVVADFWGRGIKDHRGLPWGQVQAKPGKGTGNGFEWFRRAGRWFHRMKHAGKLPPSYERKHPPGKPVALGREERGWRVATSVSIHRASRWHSGGRSDGGG
jgi:hypothetical protein